VYTTTRVRTNTPTRRRRRKMTTQTDPLAKSVRGANPQTVMEKITRDKVYAMTFWKEKCFAVSAETLVDLAVADLTQVGGIYGGNNRATEFLCLTLKMLQIAPEREIVVEFIKNEDHKYARLLGAFYLRLVGNSAEVYRYLEPLLNDYRKVRRRVKSGGCELTTVDAFVDELLTKDFCCDIALPRLAKRFTLEATGALEERKSLLEEDVGEGEDFETVIEKAVDEEMAKRRAMTMPGETVNVDGDDGDTRKKRSLEEEENGEKEEKKSKKKKKKKEEGEEEKGQDVEIAEANALRAKLGLKPLKG
jgi:pre-mRNA-splicing factor 38A